MKNNNKDMAFLDFLPLIGDVFNAGVSHYENVRSQHFQRAMMHEQMDWSEKMNAQQQEWQEMMWNKSNEYNSPTAQLERAKAAGINPNAIVNGGANMGSATMAQQPSIPSAPGGMSAPGFPNLLGNLGNDIKESMLLDGQLKLLKAQEKATLANAGLAEEQTQSYHLSNETFYERFNREMKQMDINYDVSEETLEQAKFAVDVLLPQQQELNDVNIEQAKGACLMMAKQLFIADEQFNLVKQEVKNAQKQEGVLESQEAANYASANAANAAANASNAQARATNAVAKNQELHNDVYMDTVYKVSKAKGIDSEKLEPMMQVIMEFKENLPKIYSPKQMEKMVDAFIDSLFPPMTYSNQKGRRNYVESGRYFENVHSAVNPVNYIPFARGFGR